MERLTRVVVIVTCAILSMWAGSRIYRDRTVPQARNQREPLERLQPNSLLVATATAAAAGSEAATLAVVEFSDFECPFCGQHARQTYLDIEREFVKTGSVRYVFRHLPLRGRHPNAAAAAQAAECARREGRFWPMHALLFQNQKALARDRLIGYGEAVALDRSSFEACLDHSADTAVPEDEAMASRLQIASTPTFLIGRLGRDGTVNVLRRLNGALPFQMFKTVLEELLTAS